MRPLMTMVFCALMLSATASAQVYRWTDERGVTNYSNKAPEISARNVSTVEDKLSVYRQDAETLDMVKRMRERRNADPDRYLRERRMRDQVLVPAVPTVAAYDPCLAGDSANCPAQPVYYGDPGVFGPGVHFRQPQLPPGAIAGNVVGNNSYTAGLSTQARLDAPRSFSRREPRASFTLPPRTGRGHHHRH